MPSRSLQSSRRDPALKHTRCLRDKARCAQVAVQDRLAARGTSSGWERVLRAKADLPEEEGLGLDSENSRNEAQSHRENCTTQRVNSNVNAEFSE